MEKLSELIFFLSEQGFKGTVVNRALQSLHDGLLKITLTVPLNLYFVVQESPRKSRRKPKIRGPRNYNLKSREVVTDSDSDSSEDSSHSR